MSTTHIHNNVPRVHSLLRDKEKDTDLSALPVSKPQLAMQSASPLSGHDWFNVISSIAAAAIIVTALALSLRYGLHPKNIIQISGNFKLSLAVLIATPIGLGACFFLTVQIFRKRVLISFERGFGFALGRGLIRLLLHPIGRKVAIGGDGQNYVNGELKDYCKNKNWAQIRGQAMWETYGYDAIKEMKDEEYEELASKIVDEKVLEENVNKPLRIVEMTTRDNVTLRGLWYFSDINKPTVILFHGNGMYAEDMYDLWGSYYRIKGYNILSMEYRGYGMSEGASQDRGQEINAYLDAETALKFVLGQGIEKDKIIAHGYSLGGAYAAALGYFFNVKKVILDHTFTKYAAVTHHVTRRFTFGIFTAGSHDEAIKHAYLPDTRKADPIIGARDLKTDKWNTLKKVKNMDKSVEIFVIYGEKDKLMNPELMKNFTQARNYDAEKTKMRLAQIEGGHVHAHKIFGSAAEFKLDAFLAEPVA